MSPDAPIPAKYSELIRHWSTVLNGADVDLDEFKKEWDGILAHLAKQSEGK
jgi:hypothetical protein